MKVFECERVILLQEETNKTLTVAQKERNKCIENIEVSWDTYMYTESHTTNTLSMYMYICIYI